MEGEGRERGEGAVERRVGGGGGGGGEEGRLGNRGLPQTQSTVSKLQRKKSPHIPIQDVSLNVLDPDAPDFAETLTETQKSVCSCIPL